MDALITEAMRKAAVAWLDVPGRAPYLVWCLWLDDALYLVSGPGEQSAPGLVRARTVTVTARGDHGGAIISWPALVSHLHPADVAWPAVAAQLAAKRLNSAPDLTARWATTPALTLTRLTPLHPPPGQPDLGRIGSL